MVLECEVLFIGNHRNEKRRQFLDRSSKNMMRCHLNFISCNESQVDHGWRLFTIQATRLARTFTLELLQKISSSISKLFALKNAGTVFLLQK